MPANLATVSREVFLDVRALFEQGFRGFSVHQTGFDHPLKDEGQVDFFALGDGFGGFHKGLFGIPTQEFKFGALITEEG